MHREEEFRVALPRAPAGLGPVLVIALYGAGLVGLYAWAGKWSGDRKRSPSDEDDVRRPPVLMASPTEPPPEEMDEGRMQSEIEDLRSQRRRFADEKASYEQMSAELTKELNVERESRQQMGNKLDAIQAGIEALREAMESQSVPSWRWSALLQDRDEATSALLEPFVWSAFELRARVDPATRATLVDLAGESGPEGIRSKARRTLEKIEALEKKKEKDVPADDSR